MLLSIDSYVVNLFTFYLYHFKAMISHFEHVSLENKDSKLIFTPIPVLFASPSQTLLLFMLPSPVSFFECSQWPSFHRNRKLRNMFFWFL